MFIAFLAASRDRGREREHLDLQTFASVCIRRCDAKRHTRYTTSRQLMVMRNFQCMYCSINVFNIMMMYLLCAEFNLDVVNQVLGGTLDAANIVLCLYTAISCQNVWCCSRISSDANRKCFWLFL